MPTPTVYDWTLVCLAIGVIQLGLALRFAWRFRGDRARPPSSYAPSVAVIAPWTGVPAEYDSNIASLLRQEYEGKVEYVFVAPSRDDPAYAAIAETLGSLKDARARLLCSDARPARCSGKILDMLYVLERLSSVPDIFLFTDSDTGARPDWIARMVEPLKDARVGVSTNVTLYLPHAPNFSSCLRLAWLAHSMPYYEPMGLATGNAIAVRRADFESLGVAKMWRTVLDEDLALAARFRSAGLKTHFSACAAAVAVRPCGLADMTDRFNRWMVFCRLYDPRVYAMGAVQIALKIAILFTALRPPISWGLLSALWGLDAAFLAVVSLSYCFWQPTVYAERGRKQAWMAPLMAPLLPLLFLVNYASSLFAKRVRWGKTTWLVRGPHDVEALP